MNCRGGAAAPATLALACLLLALGSACTGATDRALGTPPAYARAAEHEGVERSSRYVAMRDGVRLAVDVILPRNLPPGARIPALLYQGRYWRSASLRGPARVMHDSVARHSQLGPFKAFFVERGYAWLDVDTRGSGASFGTRLWDYSPDEILDGADLVDWIVRQPWSDGRVAGVGVSYSGAAAELLLVNRHPAVKAAVPLFCDFDQYEDILAPGGVPHVGWIRSWADFTSRLDRNRMPFDAWWLPLFVRGVRPVDGDRGRSLLAAALREHAANFDFREMEEIVYRDDRPRSAARGAEASAAADATPSSAGVSEDASPSSPSVSSATASVDAALDSSLDAARARAEAWLEARFGPGYRALGTDLASPHAFARQIDASGVPLYAYSGWLDGAYARAAARRFATLSHPDNRLLLGPWDHALHTVSPRASRGPSRFDHAGELLRFADQHVRGLPTGLESTPRVHYFTMGAERWQSAETWPPPATPLRFYLAGEGALSREPPAATAAEDGYEVDFEAGTGSASRWAALRGRPVRNPYPDRSGRDAALLHYTSAPLAADLEVTGHPLVTLHVASSARDGAFFAYLEDVAPDGRVTHVTEGMLRALHRRVLPGGPDALGLPRRSFRRADALPLVPGEVAELQFDLLPISYVFPAGHRIRLALAGADADHFARIPAEGPVHWRVQRSSAHVSSVLLPAVPTHARGAP